MFKANAVGVAGQISKPETSVNTHAHSSLPAVGGHSQSSVQRTEVKNVYEFDAAWTQTSGDFSDREKAFKTLATAWVRGLNVTNRLTADLLEATLTASYPNQGASTTYPSIVPTTVKIDNLRLDGYPIRFNIDTKLFTDHPTKKSLADAFLTDNFHSAHAQRFQTSNNPSLAQAPGSRQLPEVGAGVVSTSIVSNVSTDHPKAVVNGHAVTLDGFGTIFLGEFLITDGSRRITVLRLKLGSPVAGDVSCAEVESNGSLII